MDNANQIDYERFTLLGYSIRDLILVANQLNEHDVTPEMLDNYASGFVMGYQAAQYEIMQALEKQVNQFSDHSNRFFAAFNAL